MFEKFTNFLEKYLQPIAIKMGQNVVIQSIGNGMLGIVAVTVGASLVSILVNLPIEPWKQFLVNIGIYTPAVELVAATTSMLAIYSVVSVAYSTGKNLNRDPRACLILSAAVFLIMMPQSIVVGETTVSALASGNLGSNGIFVAIVIGIIVPMFYDFLLKKNIRLKMPEQVPPMVSNAMTPIFAAMILFVLSLLIKWGISLTAFGDIFTMFSKLISAPLMGVLGVNPITPVIYCMLRSLFWFFGIHPSPLGAIWRPLLAVATAANVEAFMAGEPLPYMTFAVMVTFGTIGGTGSTLGLNFDMFFAKSERYKTLSKIAIVPSIFNINEPIVFSVPLMYNPIMLVPTLLAPIVGGLICGLFMMFNLININPSLNIAWVVPNAISGFMRGGFWFFFAVMLATAAQALLFLPFFKVLDKQAYQEEQENLKALNK